MAVPPAWIIHLEDLGNDNDVDDYDSLADDENVDGTDDDADDDDDDDVPDCEEEEGAPLFSTQTLREEDLVDRTFYLFIREEDLAKDDFFGRPFSFHEI